MVILWLFVAIFPGLVFLDFQFNDWESEVVEERSFAPRETDQIGGPLK